MWRLIKHHFELAIALTEYELARVSTDDDPTIRKPGMASEVLGDLLLLLGHLMRLLLQPVVLQFEELVNAISSDEHAVRIQNGEGALRS